MEGINKITPIENKATLNSKEMIFDSLIMEEIISAFIEDLDNAGFNKNEIDEFLIEINNYDEESVKGILAIPKELRERNFVKYKELIDSGKTNIKEVIKKIHENAQKNGYTLGYHTSKTNIPKNENSWDVKGSELDDRDNRLMTYYSLDYKDIYRVDRGSKLYVIRAQTGQDTNHKLDTSNNWGRADSLSIIHEIDLVKIDEQIENALKERAETLEAERDAA